MIPAPDLLDDAVWVGGPDEGSWGVVVLLEVAVDGGLEIHQGAEDPALEATSRELGEKVSTALSQEQEVGV